jgi:catechol 2,3-dioxygenase-like lactoylglutathione lyase family enzyme
MSQQLGAVTFLVRDYDEAIVFFTVKLGFKLVEDTPLGGGKRWVKVAPGGSPAPCLLLAKAATPEQQTAVGAQSGGRVFLFLETDDFARDYRAMLAAGVEFVEKPRHEPYGSVAVFRDLYGNKWDLLEVPRTRSSR